MNVSDTVQRLAKVAADFVAPPRARSQSVLEPFAAVVRMLREKGASHGVIAAILAGEQVCVSRFVVARFCRERLGLSPEPKPKRRRAKAVQLTSVAAQPIAHPPEPAPLPAPSKPVPPPPPVPPIYGASRPRGPRIADVRNL